MTIDKIRATLSERIHARDVAEIKTHALADDLSMDALYRLAFDQDTRVAGNALWCMTWYNRRQSKWLIPKREELMTLAMTSVHVTIRRLSLNLLERMPWEEEDIRTEFLDFCLERILSVAEPPGVRSLCIKLAYAQCRHYPELAGELRLILTELAQQPICPALTSIRKNTLKKL